MNAPRLYNKSTEDILSEIKEKSAAYTPEWRFDAENPDGGATLARLFAEMFQDTVERFNRIPDKYYLEFLNVLGVCAKSVSPAVGFASARLGEKAEKSVYIKKGTQLFTDISAEDGEDVRVFFETDEGFYASPAGIKAIYITDFDRDVINRAELSDLSADNPVSVFAPNEKKNILRHRFGIAHSAVLGINGAAEIRVKISDSKKSYKNEEIAERLCDASFAEWSYFSGKGKAALTARRTGDYITLTKVSREPIALTDDDGSQETDEPLPWIFCDMKNKVDEITADEIFVGSANKDDEFRAGIVPDSLFAGDTELNAEKCGYCFGKEPSAYDTFYIASKEVLSKKGAEIIVSLYIDTVIFEDKTLLNEEIDWGKKMVVDKSAVKPPPIDDIYISEVIWEYWNGYGWARLEVSGDVNPFSCKEKNPRKNIRFTCPSDIDVSMQNAAENYWIRARIIAVENRYSLRGRRFTPLLKSLVMRYDYGTNFLPAQKIMTENCLKKRTYSHGKSEGKATLFSRMEERRPAVYFVFDRKPCGFPINIYMDFIGNTKASVLSFQYLSLSGGKTDWTELKTVDKTNGFSKSGIVSLYCPDNFAEAELFGERGYWIKAEDIGADLRRNRVSPKLFGTVTNAVEITQKRSVFEERHELLAGRPRQSFKLSGKPVISCEVWVNELSEISEAELNAIKSRDKSAVKEIFDDNGELSELLIRWKPRETLANSTASDRHYELDRANGVITFGDGKHGKLPAYRKTAEAVCNFAGGGGKVGNLPKNSISGAIDGIPYVESFTNFRATCGGSDGQSMEIIRKIGAARFVHRGEAVTARDYERLILEEYTQVREVRCFENMNIRQENENGCVTIAVLPYDFDDEDYSAALCGEIYGFISKRSPLQLTASGRLSVIPAKVMRVSAAVTIRADDLEYAAEAEQNALLALSRLFGGENSSERIGNIPDKARVYDALRKAEHIARGYEIMLTGEYPGESGMVTVSLDDTRQYMYFAAQNGKHTIKFG